MHDLITSTTFEIPRGTPNLAAISLDMTTIYQAEDRLHDVRIATPNNAPEMMGYFNQVCNTVTKYLAWVEYEILQAKKYLEIAKASVILEKAPEEFKRLKDVGIKYNEDFREAMVIRDVDYQKRLDALNTLVAAKSWLEGKAWSFVRAYNSCRFVADNRSFTAASPNLTGTIGQTFNEPQQNFMGKTKFD